MKRSLWISLVTIIVIVLAMIWPTQSWLNSKDIDYDAVEKAWENGDGDEELKPEIDMMHKRRQEEERKKRPNFVGDVGIPQTMLISMKDSALPDFQRMYPEIPDATHAIAEMWKAMLFNGGIEAEFFELNEAPDKLLVKVQRGWLAEDLVDFLVNQEQVKEVLWDFETYYPPGTDEAAMEKEKERLRQEAIAKEKKKQKKRKRAAKILSKGVLSKVAKDILNIMRRWIIALLTLAWLSMYVQAKTIDYEALEKQWEKGDMDEELLEEEALAVKQYNKVSTQLDEIDRKKKTTQELEKSEMVFVTLKPKELSAFAAKYPHFEKPLSELCAMWKNMLLNGGLDVNFYELESNKVLAGLQKGSKVKELHQFFFEQNEVAEIQWDSKTLYPPTASAKPAKKPRRKKRQPKTEL